MKKKLALLLSAVMVATMVPMTAFADTTNSISNTVTGKAEMIYAQNATLADGTTTRNGVAPVLTIEKGHLNDLNLGSGDTTEFELSLTNAEWLAQADLAYANVVKSTSLTTDGNVLNPVASTQIQLTRLTDKLVAVKLTGPMVKPTSGDANIKISLNTKLKGEGDAEVTINKLSSVVSGGTFKFANVASGATSTTIEGLTDVRESSTGTKIKSLILREATAGSFKAGTVNLKLSNGFEFIGAPTVVGSDGVTINNIQVVSGSDGQEVEFTIGGAVPTGSPARIVIDGIMLSFDSDEVDAGAICTLTISGNGAGITRQTLDVATARDYAVTFTAENKTLPTFVAGRANDDVDTLKVTLKEIISASWMDTRKTEIVFPDGVKVDAANGTPLSFDPAKGGNAATAVVKQNAKSSTIELSGDGSRTAKVELGLKFSLTIDPEFTGDIVVKLTGSGVEDDMEATIGTVIAPVIVEAETNEVKIDYRNVDISDIIIKETAVGNLERNKTLYLEIEDMDFDGTPKVEVIEGDLKIDKVKVSGGLLAITIKSASTKTPATIKVTNNQLFLNRSIPAGKYALKLIYGDGGSTTIGTEAVYIHRTSNAEIDASAYDALSATYKLDYAKTYKQVTRTTAGSDAIFQNYADPAKGTKGFNTDEVIALKDFVDVVTAGRDRDDSTFTTTIAVTIGADKLTAGKTEIALDVPAYISEGYTMLPVRAVTEALSGSAIVRWDDATKTVTLTFGQRVVNMTVGSKVMVINGVNVQMAKACEITDSRAFIPLRDLGYALGLNDSKINWDDATKTATLN